MDDTSQKVQNANTHSLQRQNHKHAHSNRSVPGSVQGGDGTLHAHAWVMGSIWRKTHVALPRHTANSEHTIGASTHQQRCCHGCCSLQSLPLRFPRPSRHRPVSRESKVKLHPLGLWRNCHRRFKMQTLTCCDGAEVTSTRTTVGQFKGAMDESSGKV
jgi:hypothetical protein